MKRKQRNAYRDIDVLLPELEAKRDAIRARLQDFAAIPPRSYFWEMAYCLLTPQSSAANAGKAVESLLAAGFAEHDVEVAQILGDRKHYIRFHNTKARHLAEAQRQWQRTAGMLAEGKTPQEERAWLVLHVKGLGWKEASHFLRNIGRRDLAILDRHILRNLVRHRAIRSLPRTLTARKYKDIEQRFHSFAEALGVTIDELDLLFWSRETGEILK